MPDNIADFSDSELKLIVQTLSERYGRRVAVQTGEADIQLNPGIDALDSCPVAYWEERGAHFVVFKLDEARFKAQFFYNETTQYGTGKDSYDNLGDCVVTLLQVQADHEQQMKGIRSGMTRLDLQDDNYDGPLVI